MGKANADILELELPEERLGLLSMALAGPPRSPMGRYENSFRETVEHLGGARFSCVQDTEPRA